MAKKGDMSIQTIVIAVLALLVLAILAYIFVTKSKQYNAGMSTCKEGGYGDCLTKTDCYKKSGVVITTAVCSATDVKAGKICCKTIS